MIKVINAVYMVPGDRYKLTQPDGTMKEVTYIATTEDEGFGRMRIMGTQDRIGRTTVHLVHNSGLVAGEGKGWVDFADESLNELKEKA